MKYRVVGLERRGKLFLAALLKNDMDKEDVYLESGEKVTLAISKNLMTFYKSIEASDEKTLKIALSQMREEFSKEHVDLAMLWECCELEQGYSFQQLVETYFGGHMDVQSGPLFVSLSEDSYYFQIKAGLFFREPPAKVENKQSQEHREKDKREEEQHFISWLKGEKNASLDTTSESVQKLLEALKRHALCGEENSIPEGRRLAQILEMDCDDLLILLEDKGIVPKDINEMLYRYQVSVEHPTKAIAESEEIIACKDVLEGRKVLKDMWNIAIDDAETEEVDDAISYHEEEGLQVLGVHIADVAFHIPIESELDKFAADRFSTLYFPEGKMTLFPLSLVKEKLTLAPNIPRPTISGFFYFDNNFNLVKTRFEQTVLNLARRGTYEETAQGLGQEKQFCTLCQIAQALRERRIQAGALITQIPDVKIKVEAGEVSLQLTAAEYPGQLVVSEMMILYNQLVAKELSDHKIPALFRIQQEKPQTTPTPISPQDPLYPLKIRWGMKPSTLSTTVSPHWTLGLSTYTQATSPMRRYSDLIIQRQLIAYLNRGNPPYSEQQLQEIKFVMERNEKTSKAVGFGRYIFWIYKYLKQNKSKVYDGIVSRVMENMHVMIFIPELLQEFSYKVEDAADAQEGRQFKLRLQHASPRKKKAYWYISH